jgi:LPS sulfotransferase NodH
MTDVVKWFPLGVSSDDDTPAYDEAVIIAITARVGSTALVSALANSGLACEIHENLNPRHFLPGLLNQVGGSTVQSYLNRCHIRYMRTNTFILKTNFWDMCRFIPESRMTQIFPKARYIYMYRRDLVAQAYSLWKATSTGFLHQKIGEDSPPKINEVDEYEIFKKCISIQKEALQWQYYFIKHSVRPQFICYEDLLSDNIGIIKKSYRYVTGNQYEGIFETDYVRITNDVDEYNIKCIKEKFGL